MSAPRGVRRQNALRLSVDPIACEAYGYCAELLREMVTLDEWGYPIVDGSPVPKHLVAVAKKAARDCPRRALLLSVERAGCQPAPVRSNTSRPNVEVTVAASPSRASPKTSSTVASSEKSL